MKRYITILAVFALCSLRCNAQTKVSVHAGDAPLETLLTDEQKNSVTHLTITGKLQDDDYAFIRNALLDRLEELNLRDAEIDTIPQNAFNHYCDEEATGYSYKKTIYLPATVKYLSDYSLPVCNANTKYIIAGEYPDLGENVYFQNRGDYGISNSNILIYPSADNSFLKMEDNCVCSANGKVLYFINNENRNYYSEFCVDKIPSGIQTIYKNTFENRFIYFYYLEIPETVDSIGDRAFNNIYSTYGSTGINESRSNFPMGNIAWKSSTPPRLGKNVWKDENDYTNLFLAGLAVYAPDESIDIYKNTEEWNVIPYYFKLSGFDGTNINVSVKAGAKPLEALLTDEQKNSVTHLTITGTLLGEDYAFIRNTLLDRLIKLNLKDAEIDTIPKHAFEYLEHKDFHFPDIQITLPKTLKKISDYAFYSNSGSCFSLKLTGPFPSLGQKWDSSVYEFKTSEDNEHCFYCEKCEGIYSSDKQNLFYSKYKIHEGTKIISTRAFANAEFYDFTIPQSVDSIGDYAFQDATVPLPTCRECPPPTISCEAVIPPKLGKGVFDSSDLTFFYVPDESVELYKNAEGWKDLYIMPISLSDIRTLSQAKAMSVKFENGYCILKHDSKTISHIAVYNTGGQKLCTKDAEANEVCIPKQVLTSPFSLLNIHYADGTAETIKIKP